MLGRGELRCIGATTLDEYRKYIEKDPALERRFQQVYVDQPSVTSTIAILRGLRERYVCAFAPISCDATGFFHQLQPCTLPPCYTDGCGLFTQAICRVRWRHQLD